MLVRSEAGVTYNRLVYDPSELANFPGNGTFIPSNDDRERQVRPATEKVLRQERVPYRANVTGFAGLDLPFPRNEGALNDLSTGRRLFWIGALATAIVFAVGALITISWGVVRMVAQLLRAFS